MAALKVAVVVGTVLNLINQGDVLWGESTLSIPHVALNYLVPYLVSSHSIVNAWHVQKATLGLTPKQRLKARENAAGD